MHKFSIVLISSNADRVSASIKSILRQSMPGSAMQLLVFGANDEIGSLCQRYAKQFEGQIIYTDANDKSDSWKKNRAIKMSDGEYINFMEDGSEWSIPTLKNVDAFFTTHPNVNAVLCRRLVWEKGEYTLDRFTYKFNSNIDVTNVSEKQSRFNVHLHPFFFRRKSIKKLQFSETEYSFEEEKYITNLLTENKKYSNYIVCYEDVEFLTKVILRDGIYGLADEKCLYYAPKNYVGVFKITDFKRLRDYSYLHQKKYVELFLKLSTEEYAKYKTYLQYVALFILWPRLKSSFSRLADEEYKENVTKLVDYTLKNVKYRVINSKIFTDTEHRLYALKRRKNANIFETMTVEGLEEQGFPVCTSKNVLVRKMLVQGERLYIEGQLTLLVPPDRYEFGFKNTQNVISVYFDPTLSEYTYALNDDVVLKKRGFYAFLPLDKIEGVYPFVNIDGKEYRVGMVGEDSLGQQTTRVVIENGEIHLVRV